MSALLSFANRIVVGHAALSSPNSFAAGLPLSNLFDRRLGLPARQDAGPAEFRVDVTFPTVQRCRVVGLLNCNRRWLDPAISSASTYITMTIRASNVSVNGTDVFTGTYDLGEAGTRETDRGFIMPLPSAITARYWSIRATWDKPVGELWNQSGLLWLADAIEIGGANVKGVDRDWYIDHIDPSIVRRSRGQQVYTDEKVHYRHLQSKSSIESEAAVFGAQINNYQNSIQQALIRNGGSREVILIPRIPPGSWVPNSAGWDARQFIQRTAVYGLMPGTTRIGHQAGKNFTMPLASTLVR